MERDAAVVPDASLRIVQWFGAALVAIQEGDLDRARELLTRVVTHDETQVEAWWWLSRIIEDPEVREVCLDNILLLDPEHREAQVEKKVILHQRVEEEARVEAAARAAVPVDTDPLEDPWRCPYCLAPTADCDRVCPQCQQSLWKMRHKATIPAYRQCIALNGGLILMSVVLSVALLNNVRFVLSLAQLDLDLFALYWGGADISLELQEVVFSILPRWLYYWALSIGLLSFLNVVLLLIGMVFRSMKVYIASLAVNGVQIVTIWVYNVGALTRYRSELRYYMGLLMEQAVIGELSGQLFGYLDGVLIVLGGLVFMFAVFALLLLVAAGRHFEVIEKRHRLEIDPGTRRSAVGLRLHGREHFERGRWAAAALHFRAALAMREDVDLYLSLALAYSRLKIFDRAALALTGARKFIIEGSEDERIAPIAAIVARREAEAEIET